MFSTTHLIWIAISFIIVAILTVRLAVLQIIRQTVHLVLAVLILIPMKTMKKIGLTGFLSVNK